MTSDFIWKVQLRFTLFPSRKEKYISHSLSGTAVHQQSTSMETKSFLWAPHLGHMDLYVLAYEYFL